MSTDADLAAQRDTYRAMCQAALDQLHIAERTIARQREQLQEMRDERERIARSLFNV